MTSLTIAGGIYREICTWPSWDQVYGSAGRAACAVAGSLVQNVRLVSYASAEILKRFEPRAKLDGIALEISPCAKSISFDYLHPMAVPIVRPSLRTLEILDPLAADAEVVLRFGMLESSVRVNAGYCVYDPQSSIDAQIFSANGSRAEVLAIVANRDEIRSLTGLSDVTDGAKKLLQDGAQVVVVKSGSEGAYVFDANGLSEAVPAYVADRVFTIGSGDVFAATFAAAWGVKRQSPLEAANLASKAVAEYVALRDLPVRPFNILSDTRPDPLRSQTRKVYLAGPFFTISQRWLIDETLRCLDELRQKVFSPVHEIGSGPAEIVAPADLKAIDDSDCLFAILDGLDSGTIFEIGYARAKGIPVYAFAQNVADEDLKMVAGSGCGIFSDFVTALHHLAWAL